MDAETGRLEIERIYGCLPADANGFMFQCGFSESRNGQTIVCCDTGNMCNQEIVPVYNERKHMLPNRTDLDPQQRYIGIDLSGPTIITSGLLFVILMIGLAIYGLWKRCRCCCCSGPDGDKSKRHDDDVENGDNIPDELTVTTTTTAIILTTDADAPRLVQRRIHKEITVQQPIGSGRFGDVWLAQFRGQNVAVKVFEHDAEDICLREIDVYKLVRHENVQHCIGSDVQSDGRRILVTPYHELRTLHSFLAHATEPLQTSKLCQLAYTLAAGLDYLHTEICGLSGKPSIAHGDITARNVLIRRDLQCVIADFGLAVKKLPNGDHIEAPARARAEPSDWRYVAPERMSDTFAAQASFGAYMMADIYAAGSVLWQMARCCATSNISNDANRTGTNDEERNEVSLVCEGYDLPYATELQTTSKPTLDVVRRLVCIDGCRPELPARWEECGDEIMRTMRCIVMDCWKENAAARLTALRVKKTLGKLRKNAAV